MSRNTKIGLAVLIALLAIFGIIYAIASPGGNVSTGSKDYTLVVVDDQGSEQEYSASTDQEYLLGAMEELSENGDFSFEGTPGNPGYFVNTVNGLTADFDTDGAYWAIYVNGDYGMNGVDTQPVTDGDEYRLVYEKG